MPTLRRQVSNISDTTQPRQLQDLFKQFGEVEAIKMLPAEGAALVNLTNISSAAAAKDALHGLMMGGNADWKLQVSYTRPQTGTATTGDGGRPA